MSKRKGTKAERDILSLFWATADWAAIRAPGSGSARFPSPDILAGNTTRTIAIECKFTSKQVQYLTKKEIQQLQEFSRRFNAEAWIAVKFARRGLFFLQIKDLEETAKFYVTSLPKAEKKGVSFKELIRDS